MIRFLSVFLFFLLAVPAMAQTSIGRDSQDYPCLMVDGKVFVPRGYNVLAQNQGAPYPSFDTFDAGRFDPAALQSDFSALQAGGYNYVRLWLTGYDADDGFGLSGPGISDAYLANVLHGLQMARAHGLHVVLTGRFRPGLWLPANYIPAGLPPENEVGGMNRLLLLPAMAKATGAFYADLLNRLTQADPGILSTLLYFDLYNELHFDLSKPPFNQMAGTYVYAGQTYNLAAPSSRQALMDAAGTAWLRTVAAAVHEADPSLLVTASTFPVAAFGHQGFDGGMLVGKPGRWKPYPLRPAVLLAGGADLIDIHLYTHPAQNGRAGTASDVLAYLAKGGITPVLAKRVPLIFGEFGADDLFIAHPGTTLPEMDATWRALRPLHPAGYALWVLRDGMAVQPQGERELLQCFGRGAPVCP